MTEGGGRDGGVREEGVDGEKKGERRERRRVGGGWRGEGEMEGRTRGLEVRMREGGMGGRYGWRQRRGRESGSEEGGGGGRVGLREKEESEGLKEEEGREGGLEGERGE